MAVRSVGRKAPSGPLGGSQWAEPIAYESGFRVERKGENLIIQAATPRYRKADDQHDLMAEYRRSGKDRSTGKQTTGKDAPHIRFANADDDGQLIDFTKRFGPVVASAFTRFPGQFIAVEPPKKLGGGRRLYQNVQLPQEGRQDLAELGCEQRIYSAALGLVVEQRKKAIEYDFQLASEGIGTIAELIRDWPRQWERERKLRGCNPPWKIERDTIKKIRAYGEVDPQKVHPQYFAQWVICELLNVFPPKVYATPDEHHHSLWFGIRPVLYAILSREFHFEREVALCANPNCRDYFAAERYGQKYCNETCSRQHRQREYWQVRGKDIRKKRLKKRLKVS